MALFLFNPEQMLIGKLSKGMHKPFHRNDKLLVEKNIKNILNLKLLYSDYVNDDGKVIADTIAVDKNGTLHLVGYKRTAKDKFLERYQKQYEKLVEMQDIFLPLAKKAARKEDLSIYNFKAVFISSVYTPQELEEAENFPIPCTLYTWSLVGNILIFDKVKETT